MKLGAAAIVALVVMAAMPALAAEPAASAPPQVADNGDFAGRKSAYVSQARQEMDLWQDRLSQAGARTQQELDRAWTLTREEWVDLQHATMEGWDRSHSAFERATDELKAEWRKYQPHG